ncbi:unnamed protein product [Phytophthora lilii]|uniref:Unnamed protein product n=1 Tax=Phytophthora lilii TaxID=2077276 RepID=A0A9W6THE7_9STRA|nr:unnamed protein product [Phytophthora lilii]
MAMASTLATHYGDEALASISELRKQYTDEALAAMIMAAKAEPRTSSFARDLEEVQFRTWTREGKTTGEVFKMLNLDKSGDKLFESPELPLLVSYYSEFGTSRADELMTLALKTRFGETVLTKMLGEAAKQTPGQRGEECAQEPAFDSWVSYMRKINFTGWHDTTMFSKLKEVFGDGMELARALESAKTSSKHTRGTIRVINELQFYQFKQWVRQDLNPESVRTKLNYDPAKDGDALEAFKVFYAEISRKARILPNQR